MGYDVLMATKNTTKKATPAKDVSLDIDIPVEPPRPYTVGLAGEVYTVRPIKGSIGITLGAQMRNAENDPAKLKKTMDRVLSLIFGPTESKKVSARLDDPEDSLDFPHIMELVKALVEMTTGNPTT